MTLECHLSYCVPLTRVVCVDSFLSFFNRRMDSYSLQFWVWPFSKKIICMKIKLKSYFFSRKWAFKISYRIIFGIRRPMKTILQSFRHYYSHYKMAERILSFCNLSGLWSFFFQVHYVCWYLRQIFDTLINCNVMEKSFMQSR